VGWNKIRNEGEVTSDTRNKKDHKRPVGTTIRQQTGKPRRNG